MFTVQQKLFFFLTPGYFLRASDKSNFFRFPLEVRFIRSRLYLKVLCENGRGICFLSDGILLVQLGTNPAFVVNVKQKSAKKRCRSEYRKTYFNKYAHASWKELSLTLYAFA